MRKYKLKLTSGFTLIELVVVIAIVAIISAIVIFNYSSFDSTASLENVSEDIALTIRKAQVSAIGVKGVLVDNSKTEFPSYGISFNLDLNQSSTLVGSPKSFVYFADLGIGNKIYDPGIGSQCDESSLKEFNECMNIIKIKTSDIISEICRDSLCFGPDKFPKVDIVFSRPYPDAYFYFCADGSCSSNSISSVTVKVKSLENKVKQIKIWNTGQISIQ